MDDKAGAPQFSYDRVVYPTPLLEGLTPDRLRASAILHGFDPPVATRASLLEIGCGDGLNAIAWAASAPEARVVGFDLSETAIARGRSLASTAGLDNVDLHWGDILTYPRDGERYDYVVCHGVLSWVPAPVREALLALIASRLAPGGIAYLSFDGLPGAAIKAALVPFLRANITPTDDPVAALNDAARTVDLLNRATAGNARMRPYIEILMRVMQTCEPGYFYHDWLAEHYDPVDLRAFVRTAAASNLRLAGSASNEDLHPIELDPEAQALLAGYGDDHGARLIAFDLIKGPHFFHRQLLVRADAPPPPVAGGHALVTYGYDGHRDEIETDHGPATKYYFDDRTFITTQQESTRSVMDLLVQSRPAELTFGAIREATGLDEATLADVLLSVCRSNFVIARSSPPRFVLEPGERPRASGLVRAMAMAGSEVVDLRGNEVILEQDESRLMCGLCDGTRTRAEIAALMSAELGRDVPLDMVAGAIAHSARSRLFAG